MSIFTSLLLLASSCNQTADVDSKAIQYEEEKKVHKKILDSISAATPVRILETDTLIIKEYKDGRIDTIYITQNNISSIVTPKNQKQNTLENKEAMMSFLGSDDVFYDDLEGNFYAQSEENHHIFDARIARSFHGNYLKVSKVYISVALNAWVVNPNTTEIEMGQVITKNVTMVSPIYSYSPLPSPAVDCTWSALINQRITVSTTGGSGYPTTSSHMTNWTRSKRYICGRL